jgi:hypothetical protein
VTADDTRGLSRTSAEDVITQPAAMAGLSEETPASTPPAAPMTTRAPVIRRNRFLASIQMTQAIVAAPSAIATVMPSAPHRDTAWTAAP